MLWEVGDRFGFGAEELWRMPISRLEFWHRGAHALYEAEVDAAKQRDS
jgi:hypothetical protein